MKELLPPSEQNVLGGAPHKPLTGQRLFLTFAWDPKCQRAKRLSLILRQKLLASAQPAECRQSEDQNFQRNRKEKKNNTSARLLLPLLEHTAYTVFLPHLVLFLIRKGKLPKG